MRIGVKMMSYDNRFHLTEIEIDKNNFILLKRLKMKERKSTRLSKMI